MSSFLAYCGPNARTHIDDIFNHMPIKRLQEGQLINKHLPKESLNTKDTLWCHYRSEQLAISVSGSDSGVSEHNGVILAFEGYVTNIALRGEKLRIALISDFLESGQLCTQNWHGSFRLLIHYQGITRLYTDQLANRRLFYTKTNEKVIYCSHSTPLLKSLPKRTVDGANLLQFLFNGRFFSDGSAFNELRQIPAGVAHQFDHTNKTLTPFTWYQYQLASSYKSDKDALSEFKHLLDQSILSHWQRADNPVLILSGGYDSRFLLNTLAAKLSKDKLSQLSTYLWGVFNPNDDSDGAWAAKEAKRHGVIFDMHSIYIPDDASLEVMFELQSGMTGHVFSHNSDMFSCFNLAQQSKQSMLRGDEIFGPNGKELQNREQALAKVGLRELPTSIFTGFSTEQSPLNEAFTNSVDEWQQAHANQVNKLSQVADEPNDLRDILYCQERLPAFNAHLTAHRAPFLENFAPLLDMPLIDFNRQLPRHLRTDKSLFRQCFMHYYPTDGFAAYGNGFVWQYCWQKPQLAQLINQHLSQLPEPFDANFWRKIGQQLIYNSQGSQEQIATIQLATRAIVLGLWLKY